MNYISSLIPLLLVLAPMLVLYLVGIVISLTNLKRCGTPAALALAGCALLFVSTLVLPIIQGYVIESHNNSRDQTQRIGQQLMFIRAASTLVEVTAFGLLLAAVFNGRSAAIESSFDPIHAATPPPLGDSTQQPHRATIVFVLGVLSLILCPPLGIAAWMMGGNDLFAMRSGRMDPSGESLTAVGRILGIIGTVLFGVGVIVAGVWIVAMAAFIHGAR